MAEATGMSLDLSGLDKMINRLEKNLQRFVDMSEKAQLRVTDSFLKMGTQGVDNFTNQLSKAINQVMEIGKKGSTIKWDTKNLERYIDQVNTLIKVLQQAQGSGFTLPTKGLNKEFASISSLKEDLKLINQLLSKGEKTGTSATGSAIYRQLTKDEQNYLVELKRNLQEQLKTQNESIQQRLGAVRKALHQELKETQDTERKKSQARNQSYGGAIKYSNNAKTLEQERQAIINLEVAREKLKKTDADYSVKLEELNKRINSHRISIEAATKTEAQRNALTSSTRAEYSRLLVEQDKLRQSYDRLKQSQATFGATPENTKALQDIVKRYRDVYAEILRYKKSANGQLDATERKFLADQAAMYAENEKRKTDIARQEAQKRATISSADANKVITNANGARNVNQQLIAIQQLKEARDKLDKSDSNYNNTLKKLNDEIRRHQTEVDKARGKEEQLNNSKRNLMDTAGQLQRKLALVFSVSAIQGYLEKIAVVTAQFELQRKSLGILLQDQKAAQKLWGQIKDLAIQSPFQVQQLITYTKQLAAYRIESDQLYDTTKRLADVSAGLGVDMQRLILAYGQVRAAEYLRGTELRQFTEAGIPMLDELAKRFSALEGATVTTADVFERISSRMVAFEDVAAVLKEMTDTGGAFYNMQEEQSKTLAGTISNLKDRISLMLEDIGKSNSGLIKFVLDVVTFLITNWEAVAEVLKATAVVFALVKVHALMASKSLIAYAQSLGIVNGATTTSLTFTQLLNVAFLRLGKTIKTVTKAMMAFGKSNPWLLVITAALYAAMELYSYFSELNEKIREIEKESQELHDNIARINTDFSSNDFEEQKKAFRELIDLAKKEFNIDIQLDIDSMSQEQLVQKFKELRSKLDTYTDFSASFQISFERQHIGGFVDDVVEDMEDLEMTASSMFKYFEKNAGVLYSRLSKEATKFNNKELDAWGELASYRKKDSESQFQYIMRMKEAYATLGQSVVNSLTSDMDEAERELNNFFDKIEVDNNDPDKQVKIKLAIDDVAIKQEWDDFTRQFAYWVANERFSINIGLGVENIKETQWAEWQKEYNQKFSNNNWTPLSQDSPTGRLAITTASRSQTQQLDQLKNLYDNAAKAVERYNNATSQTVKLSYLSAWGVKDLQGLNDFMNKTAEAYAFLGGGDITKDRSTRKTGRKTNDLSSAYRDMLNIITTLQDEYKKFNKNLDANTAAQKVAEIYADKVKKVYEKLGWTISDIDFTTIDGVVKAMEKLGDKAKGIKELADFYRDLQVTIGKTKADDEQENLAEAFEKTKKSVEDLFDDFETFKDIEDLGIHVDFAKELFGLDAVSLDDIKKKLKEMFDQGLFDGEEGIKTYEEYLDKISQMEAEHQTQLLKDYSKYLEQTVSKRAEIQLKYFRDIERINAATEGNPKAREAMLAGLKKEYEADIQSSEWKEFKESEMYVSMYGDLQNASQKALEIMIKNLTDYKEAWDDLPVDQMNELIKKLEELKNAHAESMAEAHPWGYARSLKKSIKEDGRTPEEAQADFLKDSQEALTYESQVSDLEAILALLNKGKDATKQIASFNQKNALYLGVGVETTDELKEDVGQVLTATRSMAQFYRSGANNAQKQVDNYERLVFAQKAQVSTLETALQMANNLHGAFQGLYEALGGSNDSAAAIFTNMAMSMLNTVMQTIILQIQLKMAEIQAEALGVAFNSALGVVGWIVMGVQALAQLLTGIFTNKDNKLKEKIEDVKERIEDLEKAMEKLEEAMEKAFTSQDLTRNFEESLQNITEQIEANRAVIELENKRGKKKDEQSIKEAEENIEELMKKREELLQENVESLGGTYDFRGAAREFVDAWVDAFKETGNGLSGLEDNFKEFFQNIMLEQAVMTGAGAIMQPLIDYINKSLEDDFLMDDTEMAMTQKLQRKQLAKLDEYMNNWMTMYPDLFDTASELSGLAAGVEGITENQAEVISAYLNTIRFFVSNIDTNTAKLVELQGGVIGNETNPMVDQLRIIATQTSSINELLSSVRKNGHSQGGYGLKVFMD